MDLKFLLLRYRKYAAIFIAGFLGGVWLESFFNFGWSAAGLAFLLSVSFFFLYFVRGRQVRLFALLAAVLLGVSSGIGRMAAGNNFPAITINGESQMISGRIVAEPSVREKTAHLTVKTADEARLLVITERFPAFAFGDRLEISGEARQPENFMTETGKEFDYEKYLAVRGISAIMLYPDIKIVKKAGFSARGSLIALKNIFVRALERVLPEPHASLASGLILGGSAGLGEEAEKEFQTAGLSHITVLSGFNITVVANFFMRVLAFLPMTFSIGGGVLAIFLFVAMVGGGSAASRAAVMAALSLLARGFGRIYEAGIALIVAGFLMILWNPKILAFDVGFQLSFLATLGLIYLSPIFDGKFSFIPKKFGLRDMAATTLGAQVAVYPWIVYKIGNLSLIGFLANLLVLPVIPFVMAGGFFTGFLGAFSFILSIPAGYFSYFLLNYILQVARVASSLPLAAFDISNFPLWLTILIYAILSGVVYLSWARKKAREGLEDAH